MAERPLIDRLDETIAAIVERRDATAALRDAEVAPFARLALDLRHYPDADFKAHARAMLQRRISMTSATMRPAVREGFTTVTPYIRVASEGLVSFLVQAFDAEETLSAHGGGGGMHREVRLGDSMVMIGEGASGDVMPIAPMAFHLFVADADAAYRRAIAAGATSLGEPADRAYGERSGFVADPFGNHWYIATPLGLQSVRDALRTVTPFLHAADASGYDEFLQRALGAVEEMRHDEGGEFRYARLRIGDAAIELGTGEAMPGSYMLYVDDPDGRYQQAIAAGATSVMPLSDEPYGRVGGVVDTVGNRWFFARPPSAG
jgi:PhnB protein